MLSDGVPSTVSPRVTSNGAVAADKRSGRAQQDTARPTGQPREAQHPVCLGDLLGARAGDDRDVMTIGVDQQPTDQDGRGARI